MEGETEEVKEQEVKLKMRGLQKGYRGEWTVRI